MKVEVSKINPRGLKAQEDIPAQNWDMDSFDVKFIGPIKVDCFFVLVDKEIVVDVVVSYCREIICSRCMEEARQELKKEVKLSYNVSDLGEYLEVDNDIREEILLDFPMKVLCRPDCKGICSGCGVVLNRETCECAKSPRDIKKYKLKIPVSGGTIKFKKSKNDNKPESI